MTLDFLDYPLVEDVIMNRNAMVDKSLYLNGFLHKREEATHPLGDGSAKAS